MLVMNYQLTLTGDADMDALRQRIPEIGARFDAIPSLGIKAFLLREKGVNGSLVNQYAPFYLWVDDDAAATFLWGGAGFAGVVGHYGRPVAQTWVGGAYRRGAAYEETATWAVRVVRRLPADVDPAGPASEIDAELTARAASEPHLHSIAWGIDPRTWELVTFALHTAQPDPGDGELYEVPHLSRPHADELLASA